ncbi:MAG TPA: hypothetical protein VED01_03280 [Burkholderiales bacterium]|nr:hypothetical protein [Burkholderiales bacterium]
MRRVLLLALLAMACAPAPSDEPAITAACVRSFRPTLAAWESVHGRVPEDCAYLDAELDVQLASEDEIPCAPEASTELVVGCMVPGDAIYLLEGRDDVQLVDTSVHEWVHALAHCVDGDADRYHLRGELWAQYGPESVELQAQASAEIGECL